MFEEISFNEMIEDMHKSLGNNLSRKGNEAEKRKKSKQIHNKPTNALPLKAFRN